MGGKASAPPPPDYTPVSNASIETAQIASQTSKDQLDWAKQQYADQAPSTQAYMASMTASTNQQTSDAKAASDRYKSIYAPLQDSFAQQAQAYSSPDRTNQASAAAMADVSNTFAQQRTSALSNLESYGIDPSQTRFGALDLGTRVSQAAATAAAGTGSRVATEATGLALTGQAAGMGSGLAAQATSGYGGATSAGGAGVSAGLNTSTTYGNLMGTASQWAGNANASLGTAANALNMGYNNALGGASLNEKSSADTSAGIGQLAGIAVVGGIAI